MAEPFEARRLFMATIILISASFGCAQQREPIEAQRFSHAYKCTESIGFIAQAHGDRAWLMTPNRTIILYRHPTDFGVSYKNEHVAFWSSDQYAILRIDDRIYEKCVVNESGVPTGLYLP